ncbi:BlaI/MecI/CopY family transcriptional regulator [Actinospica sp. MGRD01-02]|uniref:BlaI/MecI/CopY family transcriptional regulator n=1 Tax=Actinospica acidithermotolerans TaxID=2828514 RepID=A0A941EG67_9ACTN|nr:BlaI/MecI/CopY family transcriptional regulator [Actinospica acidithermotolerans]MBR7830721.1 BlaI/MecI/CopY family transcriptional regulator [Actinospica acidithermotolerans]
MAPLRKPQRGTGPRRAAGALETAILNILWEAGEPLSAAEVREQLPGHVEGGTGELAYTTVVTILTRLFEKNTLFRERDGRAYRYAPVADEAGLAARRLTAMLDAAADRPAVLSGFVKNLTDNDEQLLRALLGGRAEQADADAE